MSKNRFHPKATNLLILLLLALSAVGCGALKNSWGNFRAYYNTYYNAEKSFRAGLEKVQNQPFELNPEDPVRAHQSPVQAGANDFQNAIDKGAKILRKFPDTKWIDDALLLIGKSFYYRQEFHPALQKFEELRNANQSPEMEQLAIIWKARTQLDLRLYSEGISFLETELDQHPHEWSAQRKAEMQTLLAEHHAMMENWQQAGEALTQALPNLGDKKFKGRALFLHGQVLERQERYGESYFTFSKVSESFPGYEYEYWAGIKRADVARKENNVDLALSIYEDLRRDDKNFDRVDKIEYEIAQTLEMKGEVEEAEKIYKDLLYEKQGTNIRSLKGDIYFRLGKIYSDNYSNFNIAAAYFDSSSSFGSEPTQNEEPGDAQTLADAFGEYNQLQNIIGRADSLLWLGSLPPEKLDSVLTTIRKQKRQKLLAEEESDSASRLANRDLSSSGDKRAETSMYGFLNHQDAGLLASGKTKFKIIWGNRPLADNWRRIEAVGQAERDYDQSQQKEEQSNSAMASEESQIAMDLSKIPQTEESRKDLRLEIVNAQYQLGSLFFLNLDMADSARVYFQKVVNNEEDSDLRPRAMYSLYELTSTAKNSDEHDYWRERILTEYPDTKYANNIRRRTEGSTAGTMESDSSENLREQYQRLESSQQGNKSAELRKLALENSSSEVASTIYFRAIKEYIRQAKKHRTYNDSLQLNRMWSSKEDSISLPIIIRTEDVSPEELQFKSVMWDSVRIALQEFDTTFTNASQQGQVEKLLEELTKKYQTNAAVPTCEKLGISLQVKPSMDEFLSTVVYPEKLQGSSLSGEVTYSFIVSPDGELSSYQLESKETSLGIEQAFEEAFDSTLHFEPLERKNLPPKIRCMVSFPIQR